MPSSGAWHDPYMPTTPTTTTHDSKIAAYRALATAAQLAVTALCALYLPQWPWLAVGVPGLLGAVLGKLLGVPTADVTQQALTRMAVASPDQAVAVATTALQSLPPAHAEAATTLLLGSLPPDARARSINPPPPLAAERVSVPGAAPVPGGTVIQFVGDSAYPDAPAAAPHDDDVTQPNRPQRTPPR